MLPDPLAFLMLATLGGLLAIDGSGCGQFMVSRPFVAATLGGLLVGEPAAGAAIGLVLEAFHLTVLPVGASRYPESGPPAAVAGALFGMSSGGIHAILTATVFFLIWSYVAGETVRLMRRSNAPIPEAPSVSASDLQTRHLASMAIDFARGVLLVLSGTLLLAAMLAMSRSSWGVGETVPRLVAEAAVAGLLASGLRLLGGRPAAFAIGAAAGLLLLGLRA
jgi:mannose/fructose/N-acetylgalactosamine-specific phosphotransferase system component IIC